MDLRMLLFQTIEATKGIGKSLFSNLLWLAKNKEARGGHAHGHGDKRDLDQITLDELKDLKLNLKEIAYLLTPEKIDEKVGHHDEAFESYTSTNKIARIKPREEEEFVKQVIDYMKHHHDKTKDRKFDSDNEYRTEFETIMRQSFREYQGEDGWAKIFEAAKEHGLKRVLEQFVTAKKQVDSRRYIGTVTYEQIKKHGGERRRELAKEFLDEHEHLLPDHIKEKYKVVTPDAIAHEIDDLVVEKGTEIYKSKVKYTQPKKTDPAHGGHGHGGH